MQVFLAVRAAQERATPNLILLDWDLIGSQTTDFLADLRSLSHYPKVVAFSEQDAAREEAMAAGANAFVSKVQALKRLLNTMREVGGISPLAGK